MAKRVAVKPKKKTTAELFEAIKLSLENGEYYFSDHGDAISKTRKNVNDLEVVKILEGDDKWHEAVKKAKKIGTIIFVEGTAMKIKSELRFLLMKRAWL